MEETVIGKYLKCARKVEVFRKVFPLLQKFQLRGKSQNVDWGSTFYHCMVYDLVLAVVLSHLLS